MTVNSVNENKKIDTINIKYTQIACKAVTMVDDGANFLQFPIVTKKEHF